MKKVIATKNAPAAIGPYSQAVQVGNMLFASGQLGLDPATGNFAEGGVKEQPSNETAYNKSKDERSICFSVRRDFPGPFCRCSQDFAEERSGGD